MRYALSAGARAEQFINEKLPAEWTCYSVELDIQAYDFMSGQCAEVTVFGPLPGQLVGGRGLLLRVDLGSRLAERVAELVGQLTAVPAESP